MVNGHASPMEKMAEPLTQREGEIVRLLANGLTDAEIADQLSLTVGTIKWYNRQIYGKLGVRNRVEAVAQSQEWHLLERPTSATVPVEVMRKPSHLPTQLTSFIGRAQELWELDNILHSFRLVTLTGPPGTGKTRLALQTAALAMNDFADGVHFVSLAAVNDLNLVPNAIIQTLNITVTGMGSPMQILEGYLRDKHLLLILDNFEHLLPAAPSVSQLLTLAPKLTVLVTSREALQLYGEYNYSVPPLQLPDQQETLTAEAIKECPSVDLLVQRAQTVVPDFGLDDYNAAAIAAICIHLDGLPLAIELAAARMKFYAPQMLLVRLSSRLDALNAGPRDVPARQRTLRATLAWSYELLNSDEQMLFERLGIFAGGCAEKDVEAICGERLNLAVTVGLESLLNKHLIKQELAPDGDRRFLMLETMREYALEKLTERGEQPAIAERHARYFINKAAEANVWLESHESSWLDWLETQHNNLRATLEWTLTHDLSGQMSLELIASLARFWELHGYFSEARAWLSKALNLADTSTHTKAHADAFYGISLVIQWQGDHASALRLGRAALALYQQFGDKRMAALTLVRISEVTSGMGDYEAAIEVSREGYAIACESGDKDALANAVCQIGFDYIRLGDYQKALPELQSGLTLFQEVNNKLGVALAQSGLGEIGVRMGDIKMAIPALQVSLRLREEFGDRWGIAAVLGTLAWAEMRQKNFPRAVELLKESMLIRKEIGEQGGLAWCLEKLAEIALLNQNAARATRILGAAAIIRKNGGCTIDPCDRAHYDQLIARLQKQLGREVWEAVWSEGYSMNLEDVFMQFIPGKNDF
jgi:predicted ATPase/DNA-binding CsgD family transcriptional regulator